MANCSRVDIGVMHACVPCLQVLLSKKDSRRVRVLGVKDLFECIELCLIDEQGELILPGGYEGYPRAIQSTASWVVQ